MVVQHNMRAMNSNRMLGLTASAQSKSTEKLSSGYRINRAADDAAGLSISEGMRKQIRGLTQASRNAQDGISFAQTAEGALAEVQDMLQRVNELAVQSANGINSDTQRGYLNEEVTALTTEMERIFSATKFNGQDAFGGSAAMDVFVAEENGSTATISIDTSDMKASALGSFDISSASGAKTAIGDVADAIETVSGWRSSLGAAQNRLEHTINNLDNVVENTTASESRVRDTDMATEMVKYSNANILAQAGQAMLAQSNQANQGVLSLLQ
ncbi:MAG: flagellin [Lachnospiraceae bacterium]|nr:flagellin [Lachnospiraceae bacterium]MBQ1172464.1 flagellin [Lachnospiraceae bacterium]